MRASHLLPISASPEPVGLVIADGGLGDHVPRFSAFVWGPVPDDDLDAAMRDLDAAPAATPVETPTVALC